LQDQEERSEETTPKIARDIVIGVVAGIVIEATIQFFQLGALFPVLPYIWFGIAMYLTLDGLRRSRRVQDKLIALYGRQGKRQRTMSYIIVGLIGIVVAEGYWFTIKKAFEIRASKATPPASRITGEKPKPDLPVAIPSENPAEVPPKKDNPELPPSNAKSPEKRHHEGQHKRGSSVPQSQPTTSVVTYEVRPFQPDSEGRHRILVLISSSTPMRKPGLVLVCNKPILDGTTTSSGGFLLSTGRMPNTPNNVFMFGVSMPEVIEPGTQLEVLLSADEDLHVQSVEQFLLQPLQPKD
jgi:hypothetical protein